VTLGVGTGKGSETLRSDEHKKTFIHPLWSAIVRKTLAEKESEGW
jgi:hypothetical protein